MKRLPLLLLLITMFSCYAQDQRLAAEKLILSDLQEEYVKHRLEKYLEKQLRDSIVHLKSSKNYHIATVSFQSVINGRYKAFLYVIANGKIKNKMLRLNYKYHPGYFEVSNDLPTAKNEIRYKILLPTSSAPVVVTRYEYFKITDDLDIVSQFEFDVEERDCLHRETGELIRRKIRFKNGSYFLEKRVYAFNCDDFDFVEEIKGLRLVGVEREEIDWEY